MPDGIIAPAAFACSAKGLTKAPISQRSSIAEGEASGLRDALLSRRASPCDRPGRRCARLKARRPPADDHDLPGSCRFSAEGEIQIASGPRVTRHSTDSMLKIRIRETALVAADAGNNFVCAPRHGLYRESGSARSALARPTRSARPSRKLLGQAGVIDAVAGNDGFCDGASHRLPCGQSPLWNGHGDLGNPELVIRP